MLTWDDIEPSREMRLNPGVQLAIHNQRLAALPASRPNIPRSEECGLVFSFTEASLQTHSTEWQILPGCREKSYWKFSSPLRAKTLLYPSRRLFSEDNSKLYDVKDKSSIESWQVFDMFCLSEGNDRSKKTHEFSSLLETQKNNFE